MSGLATRAHASTRFLKFNLGEACYLASAARVAGVVATTPVFAVPRPASSIAGLIHTQDGVIPLVNLSDAPRAAWNAFVLIGKPGRQVFVPATTLGGIVEIQDRQLIAANSSAFVVAQTTIGEMVMGVLSTTLLVSCAWPEDHGDGAAS